MEKIKIKMLTKSRIMINTITKMKVKKMKLILKLTMEKKKIERTTKETREKMKENVILILLKEEGN